MMQRGFGLVVVCAMTVTSAVAADSGGKQSGGAEKHVLAQEQAWVEAETKRDAKALNRILHDRFTVTFNTGKLYNKEEFIKAEMESESEAPSQTLSDETVIVDGDTAIVAGTVTLRATRKGEPYTRVGRYTTAYVLRGGQWLALAEHIVDVRPDK